MIRATRTELLKLRTTRLPWGLLAFTIAVTALHTLLFDSNAGGTGHTAIASLATHAGQREAISIPAEVLLLATVLGVIVASGEYRLRTATNTYLASPNRVQVLAAKAIAAATLGLLFGLASAAATTAIGLSFTTANGHHIVLSAATIIRYAAGATIGAALLGRPAIRRLRRAGPVASPRSIVGDSGSALSPFWTIFSSNSSARKSIRSRGKSSRSWRPIQTRGGFSGKTSTSWNA